MDPAVRLSPEHPRLRRSARVFLFDERGDVLLIRFVAELEGKPFVFWVTPGGEVEAGESDHAAAERELFEELGLRVPLVGPVHEESGGEYVHLGERVRNFDVFFAARCEREAPKLAGVTADEIALMREARWWSAAELAGTEERVYPQSMGRIWPQMKAAVGGVKAGCAPGSEDPDPEPRVLRCEYQTGSGCSASIARIEGDAA